MNKCGKYIHPCSAYLGGACVGDGAGLVVDRDIAVENHSCEVFHGRRPD